MANEITLNCKLEYSEGNVSSKLEAALDLLRNQTAAASVIIRHVQSVGTSEEQLVQGDVEGSCGWFVAVNLHATATIKLRVGPGQPDTIALGPGDPCLFKWDDSADPYVISNVDGAQLEYLLLGF